MLSTDQLQGCQGHHAGLPARSVRVDGPFAGASAAQDNIPISDAHREIVRFVRDCYAQYRAVPENRTLLKALHEQHGRETATRKRRCI